MKTRTAPVRAEGPLLRMDLGRPPEWRVTLRNDSLRRLERLQGAHVTEWVDRDATGGVRYRNESSHRTLTLRVTQAVEVWGFDASIWRFPD